MHKLYSLYHVNTNFSSINPNQLKKLITCSYNKLLDLVEYNNFNINIEASAQSLIDIHKIDKKIISRLKFLIKQNKCSFVGSGFIQMIMPLIPYELNKKNLIFGDEIYKKLLGIKPNIFYINEQAFSKSLINILNKKYDKIILEYNNSKLFNKKKYNDAYTIDTIKDDYNNKIDVIWNDHIFFQKFQKYVYNELNEIEYLSFLKKFKFYKNSYLPLYCSDVECFGFSPNRFTYEGKKNNTHWDRIEKIYKKLEDLKFNHSSLYDLRKREKIKINKIASINNPIIVKKQAKYNITRWCLTGRDDLKINTFCWRIFQNLKNSKTKNKKKWLMLCKLWSSDYRTHITDTKWDKLIKLFKSQNLINLKVKNTKRKQNKIVFTNKEIILNRKNFETIINPIKGFTIKKFFLKKKIFGFLEQGYFNSSKIDVDLFSGHSLLEYNNFRITDISNVYKRYSYTKNKNETSYTANGGMNNFLKYKKINLINKNQIEFENCYKNIPNSSLRIFYLNFNPKLFNIKDLCVKTHNGGDKFEKFFFNNLSFDYGNPVSRIVSSSNTLGATKNIIKLCDKKKEVIVKIHRNLSAIMPMIKYEKINNLYLLRLYFSCCETDDTSKDKKLNFTSKISIKVNYLN